MNKKFFHKNLTPELNSYALFENLSLELNVLIEHCSSLVKRNHSS